MVEYPRREPYHATHLTRLLFTSGAASKLSLEAVVLITHIAHAEDENWYRGPVRFWNSQLNETLGFAHPRKLNNARSLAVEQGWLRYEREHDRAQGTYWTTIPEALVASGGRKDSHSTSGMERGTPFPPVEHEVEKETISYSTSGKQSSIPMPPVEHEVESKADSYSTSGMENPTEEDSLSTSGKQSGKGNGVSYATSGKPPNPKTLNPKTNTCPVGDRTSVSGGSVGDDADTPKAGDRRRRTGERRAYTAKFEEWWSHYPRKVSKPDASRAFESAVDRIAKERNLTHEQAVGWLIQRTDAYARSMAEKDPAFVKHPGGWLNADRFNDALEVQRPRAVSSIYDDEPLPKRSWAAARRVDRATA